MSANFQDLTLLIGTLPTATAQQIPYAGVSPAALETDPDFNYDPDTQTLNVPNFSITDLTVADDIIFTKETNHDAGVAASTTANTAGGALSIFAGAASGNATGGALSLAAGASTTGTGGAVSISGGTTPSGTGGAVGLNGGDGTTVGGAINLNAGDATTTGGAINLTGGAAVTGGAVEITGGAGTSGAGGAANLLGGASTSGTGGGINVIAGATLAGTGGPTVVRGGAGTTAGGALAMRGGDGTTTGGAASLDAGAGVTQGTVSIGTTNSSAITIGKTGVVTRVNGNLSLGLAALGTSADLALGFSNAATRPTTSVDMAQIYGVDIAAGAASFGFETEEAVVADVVAASTHTVRVKWNNLTYKILLST